MEKLKDIHLAAFFILLVIIVSCDFNNHDTPLSEVDFREQLNQHIPVWMERYGVPGVSIALIKNGEMSWSDAYGFADLEKQTRMTTDTVCRTESISKSVTARGVIRLVELGEIELDDPVHRYLISWEFPESEFDTDRVTIRHLLSHSSGLPLGTIGLEYAPGEQKPSLRESLTREVHFVQEPGKSFIYSNVGFNLLELLIEDVSGRSFADFMEEEILFPLGMNNSSYKWREDFSTSVPNGHKLNGEPVSVYVYSDKAAGGLFASTDDIARFVASGMLNEFYSEENILTQNSIRELYSPVIDMADIYAFVADYYGLGHFIETMPVGQKAVFHGGQGNGWMTHFHLVPETGDGIVILTNSSRSWPLISHILSEWAEWSGYGSVGMGLITKAITGLWILIGLILTISAWQVFRVSRNSVKGKRKLDLNVMGYSGFQYVQLTLGIVLLSFMIWSVTREFLIIASLFPGVSGWVMGSLSFVAFTLILSAVFSAGENKKQ